MIKSEIDATVAAIRALRKAGGKDVQFSASDNERAAMKRKMNKARDIENMKDDPVWFKQHREDTRYVQWADGMYVMLDDLDGDYELALVENSLRGSVYKDYTEFSFGTYENCIGVLLHTSGYWDQEHSSFKTKLTRAQALYIATGDVSI
jgi:hypothetical protein